MSTADNHAGAFSACALVPDLCRSFTRDLSNPVPDQGHTDHKQHIASPGGTVNIPWTSVHATDQEVMSATNLLSQTGRIKKYLTDGWKRVSVCSEVAYSDSWV